MIALVAALVGAALCGFVAGVYAPRRTCRHSWTLELAPRRVRLFCPLCGETSPGWDLALGRPRVS